MPNELIKQYREIEAEIVKQFEKKIGIEMDYKSGNFYFWHDYYMITIDDVIIDLESNTSDTEYMRFIDFFAVTEQRCSYENWLKLGGYKNRKNIFKLLSKQKEESLLASEQSVKKTEKYLNEAIERFENEK